MTYDLLIRNGTIVTAKASFAADLAVQDGRIAAIGADLGGAAKTVDATGKLVMPGGVDPHCHIEQVSGMGQMNADTFETATRSAAMGGTTSLICFAAQHKGQRLADVMQDYAARARRGAMVDHAFHILISDTSVPDFARDLGDLIMQGHRSIKVFTTYGIRLGDQDILNVMAIARAHGALVCVHAENDGLIAFTKSALLDAGLTRPEHHAISHPRMAEIEAVERICRFAEYLDQPTMLFHISTRQGAAALAAARTRGAPVWGETCPHYLLSTAEVLQRDGIEGAKWMCSPPQRTHDDTEALWQALAAGDLQVISSDHAPYRYDETGKLSAGPDATFAQISNGMPGLEPRLPLLFDAMIGQAKGTPEQFADLTATAPAKLYGLQQKGHLAPGMDADIVIWDPQRSHTYGDNDLHDNVGYNPWSGRTVQGWPTQVYLRGNLLVDDGAYHGQPGTGAWIDRPEPALTPNGQQAPELRFIESHRP